MRLSAIFILFRFVPFLSAFAVVHVLYMTFFSSDVVQNVVQISARTMPLIGSTDLPRSMPPQRQK
jgi:hypothetical protein